MGRIKHAFLPLLVLILCIKASALPDTLVPVGRVVGIQLQSQGVLVAGLTEGSSPAGVAGLTAGDQICGVDGQLVQSARALRATVERSGGEKLRLTVLRGGAEEEFSVKPEKTSAGYRLGLLVRDEAAGIGTLTFYDPETGICGALGHGVSDAGGGLLSLSQGVMTEASVLELRPGTPGAHGAILGGGKPGEIVGYVTENLDCGIFGKLNEDYVSGTALPVAAASQVHPGPASIMANLEDTVVKCYDVKLVRLYTPSGSGKDMMLRITDPDLLEKTGGIIQGMSGSPILQDGRFVGAVTHVLVNDPTCGYGVYLETMLSETACYSQTPAA